MECYLKLIEENRMKMSLKWCCQNLQLPRNCRDIKLAINQILVTIIAEVGMTLLNSRHYLRYGTVLIFLLVSNAAIHAEILQFN